MRPRLWQSVGGSALALLSLQGCHCCRQSCAPPPPPCSTPVTGGVLPSHPLQPYQATPGGPWPGPPPGEPIIRQVPAGPPAAVPAPPGAVVVPPSPTPSAPPAGTPLPPAPVPAPNPVAPGISGYGPAGVAPESPWQPAPAPGAAGNPEPPPVGPRLNPPVAVREQPGSDRPAPAEPPRATPSFPVGIPRFSNALQNVAAGLRPDPEGWDWLRANRYRTALRVRLPGEDDSSDRDIAQRHGLKYLSIEVSPATLSRAAVDRFTRIVDDPNNRSLFVYDKNGVLAGGLWYLYFRLAENHTDDEARVLAGRLGLHEPDADNREMWLAIQTLLGESRR